MNGQFDKGSARISNCILIDKTTMCSQEKFKRLPEPSWVSLPRDHGL